VRGAAAAGNFEQRRLVGSGHGEAERFKMICAESSAVWKRRIQTDPQVCGGRPRVKGTRLTVEFLLGLKAAGWTDAHILENYRLLRDEDLHSAFAFARDLIAEEKFLVLPESP
jgi:uncharacterized protein (DUF433 family)